MTKTEAAILVKHAPFIEAYAKGKHIEVHVPGIGWKPIDEPDFNREDDAYRIKPEPRSVWKVEFKGEVTGEIMLSSQTYVTKDDAEYRGPGNFQNFIRVVEFVEKLT